MLQTPPFLPCFYPELFADDDNNRRHTTGPRTFKPPVVAGHSFKDQNKSAPAARPPAALALSAPPLQPARAASSGWLSVELAVKMAMSRPALWLQRSSE